MAVPTYSTDLALIDDAQAVGPYVATGGGASALNDETDYFINNTQCISKNGFTATQKGIMFDAGTAPTITAGDAVFIWGRQANRNILNTVANSGGAVIMGTSNSVFAGFNVDGSDVEGSSLTSWVTYAVDPTQTSSYSSGSPGAASTWDHFGMEWDMLGSGSLKGAPNAIGVIRHGRELRAVDGDVGNGYATFDGMAIHDADISRRYGILTPISGGYWFHGAIVMGQSGTSVDFRDSDRSILVLDDPLVPAGFNEFVIENASSNVQWDGISITALGTNSPFLLTLGVGTFAGDLCRFTGASTTTFASTSVCTNTTWDACARINLNEADISGSSVINSTVAADEGAVFDDRTTTGSTTLSELDNTTFIQGAAAHHAIRFGANVDDDITLTGIEFSGFSSVADATGATLRFDATTGSMNVNLVGCTVDGAPATSGNIGVDDAAGIAVTLVIDPVTISVNVTDSLGANIENARVFVETAAVISGGEMFEAAVTTLTQSAGVATCTTSAVHGLATNDWVVIRGAQPDEYNKVAQVTVSSTTIFTYAVNSGISSPATGTPVVSFVALQGLTNASGNIEATRTWGAAQTQVGWARKKNTSSPFYKDDAISFTVDTSNGNAVSATLQPDE